MRFHMGFSFRLKNLKKFLIPFLIGLASYFGFSFFNLDIVHAYENLDTGYYVDYIDYDFSNQTFGDYSFRDVWNLLTGSSDYYDIYIQANYNNSTDTFGLIPYFIPKNTSADVYSLAVGTSNGNVFNSYGYSGIPSGVFSYYIPIGSTFGSNEYDVIYNCLYNNTGCNNINYFSVPTSSTINLFNINSDTIINNNSDAFFLVPFNLQQGNFFPLYNNSGITFKFNYLSYSNSSTTFAKNLYINGTLINNGDTISTYCDIYDCSNIGNGGTDPSIYEGYLNEFPYVYTNTSSFTDYVINMNFFPTDIEGYTNNFDYTIEYYGRINNSTYYTYDKLTCNNTTSLNISESYELIISDIQCNGNLSNYDKFFVTIKPNYIHYDFMKTIASFQIDATSGNLNYDTDINNDLYDDFNLSINGALILSSRVTNRDIKAYFKSDYEDLRFDYISNADESLNLQITGVLYRTLPPPKVLTFGNITKKNLFIYGYGNNMNLDVFLSSRSMVSFINNNTLTYYDNEGNIVTNNISVSYYDNNNSDDYNIDSLFSYINNYLVDIRQDLAGIHNLMTDIYSSIPFSFRYFILVFYVIGLIYILYREMRR